MMVTKNPTLPAIRGIERLLPLNVSALLGHRDMVWYLYSVTEDTVLPEEDRIALLIATITEDLFGDTMSKPLVSTVPKQTPNILSYFSVQLNPTSSQGPSNSQESQHRDPTKYFPLFKAALKGDWATAMEFLKSNPGAVRVPITYTDETALHIAAGTKRVEFVEEMVKWMQPYDLALKNKYDNTALYYAAATGITQIAKVMVTKNPTLPVIRGCKQLLPLNISALLGHRDMVWYLYSVTEETVLTEDDRIALLIATITTDLFDVALFLLKKYPSLAIARDRYGETALHVLARKPSAFASGCHFGLWQRFIYSCDRVEVSNVTSDEKDQQVCQGSLAPAVQSLNRLLWEILKSLVPSIVLVHETKVMNIQAVEVVKVIWNEILLLKGWQISSILTEPSRPLFTAVELGIVEFISVLIHSSPDLIWKVDDESRSIFHIAVAYRQEKIFNLIYDLGALKECIASFVDSNDNNMLHLAAKLAPSSRLNTISGAALQMQREYQWFKEVGKIVLPFYIEMKNSDGRTPVMMFTEEHANLVKEGEKWMKDTASSCMVVATLIATVVFAAAFTVPGGDSSSNGIPIFIKDKSFMVFAISDALALFSSATSVLMFLSILTSRYAEEDFAMSLPKRMIIGLATLFVSIATMMIAFSATFFIVLQSRLAWVAIPIAVVACVPVTVFAFLQFPLFIDMNCSTYGFGIFNRSPKHVLYLHI
ncbi:hypothetical protein NE237_000945 [Protea cynaroides]|uniref:PGG domain-containing protein n=1 Tax=Protea cynaroides TaxID=273540 RepID=A0A9Q0QXZ4_9MAGN|nr:hypothetical protein NE237_000945 [Protea cynaroides]